jgi:hypothetical protein
MIQIIDENWRTKQTKISHDTIKRITLMNPSKRDAGIVTNLTKEDLIITDTDQINRICLEKLQ